MSDQMSLFGAGLYEPQPADLEGLLAGPGQAVRRAGTARLSVILAGSWRVDALLAACAERGVAAQSVPSGAGPEVTGGGTVVRTEFSARLAPLAARWVRGAVKRPPPGFRFTDNRLRLWAVCAGAVDPAGFLLRMSPSDEQSWPAIGSALAAAGVDAEFVGSRAGGSAYRVSSRRRLKRLRALIGEPPAGTEGDWPE